MKDQIINNLAVEIATLNVKLATVQAETAQLQQQLQAKENEDINHEN